MKLKSKTSVFLISAALALAALSSCTTKKSDTHGMPPSPPKEFGMGSMPGKPPRGNPADGDGFGGGTPPGMPGGPGHNGSAGIQYSGAVELASAQSQNGETYQSSEADQSALLITGVHSVNITNPTVVKTGSSSGGDSCNFYGLNAAVLVKGGAAAAITGGSIVSDADGANGVFSYGGNGGMNGGDGDGTRVIIRDTKITTTGNGSGGIMTTGGGITEAYNLDITTSGGSSAAIRTDRGGGTVIVDGGVYTTSGLGSPSIYSTADITVSNATLVSRLSEGVCIEGKNSITLNSCDLSASNTSRNGNATFLDTIMIYQSMSGDADSGTSSFTMNGGSITSRSGHVLHVTNTNAIITLNDVQIKNEASEGILLSVCADGWSGASNVATLNAVNQRLDGTILVGSDSSLSLNLSDGSTFEGRIDGKISDATGKKVSSKAGAVSVSMDASSTWILTGDTYISSFAGDFSRVALNGHKLYVNGKLVKQES